MYKTLLTGKTLLKSAWMIKHFENYDLYFSHFVYTNTTFWDVSTITHYSFKGLGIQTHSCSERPNRHLPKSELKTYVFAIYTIRTSETSYPHIVKIDQDDEGDSKVHPNMFSILWMTPVRCSIQKFEYIQNWLKTYQIWFSRIICPSKSYYMSKCPQGRKVCDSHFYESDG